MKFSEVLTTAIRNSEIPLRYEPGAEEAIVDQVVPLLHAWLAAHAPESPASDFDYGRKAVIAQLLDELSGGVDLPE